MISISPTVVSAAVVVLLPPPLVNIRPLYPLPPGQLFVWSTTAIVPTP